MKNILKVFVLFLFILIGVIILDTLQARLFKHSPILHWKEPLVDQDSWKDKGLLMDTYYCTKEQDIITVYWKWKATKFTCPIE